jgi:hypothetical protein
MAGSSVKTNNNINEQIKIIKKLGKTAKFVEAIIKRDRPFLSLGNLQKLLLLKEELKKKPKVELKEKSKVELKEKSKVELKEKSKVEIEKKPKDELKENRVAKFRKEKTFESLRRFYITLFFQSPKTKIAKEFFEQYGITLEDVSIELRKGFPGGDKEKIKKFLLLIKQYPKNTLINSF